MEYPQSIEDQDAGDCRGEVHVLMGMITIRETVKNSLSTHLAHLDLMK